MEQKAIYKITNNINGKIYIGQSIHPKRRWIEHKTKAKTKADNFPIHLAISKYGSENFSFEIIEWAKNYNQREKDWIKFYNSICPNGYNIAKGGSNNVMFGEDHPRNTITNEKLKNIISELKENKLNDPGIAKKYNTTAKIVSDINKGITHRIENQIYPIRNTDIRPNRLSNIEAARIKYILKTTKLSYQQIADMFHTRKSIVYQINKGIDFHTDYDNYPIRKQRRFNENQRFNN